MSDATRMEEGHSSSNVPSKREPEVPVERNVVVEQHVIQTPFRAVFTDNSHIRWRIFHCSPDKLAQVLVL